jgi:hypothetical protein
MSSFLPHRTGADCRVIMRIIPLVLGTGDAAKSVGYDPGESTSGLFPQQQ